MMQRSHESETHSENTLNEPCLHQHICQHETRHSKVHKETKRERKTRACKSVWWSTAYQLPHHAHGVALAARQVLLLSEPLPIGLYPVERRHQDEGVEVAGPAKFWQALSRLWNTSSTAAEGERPEKKVACSPVQRWPGFDQRSTITDQPRVCSLFSVHTTTTRTNTRHRRAHREPERRRGLEIAVWVRGRRRER